MKIFTSTFCTNIRALYFCNILKFKHFPMGYIFCLTFGFLLVYSWYTKITNLIKIKERGIRQQPVMSLQAYRLIKEKIIRNEFESLQKLNDSLLAKELKISRTPVREALVMLEREGLISRSESSRGFYLKAFSVKDVYDLYGYRQILEIGAAEHAIKNVTREDIIKMSSILEDVDHIAKNKSPSEALVKALDFHIRFSEVGTNSVFLLDALRNCYEKLTLISWSCQNLEMTAKSGAEHVEILEALKAGDLGDLQRRIRQHITRARDRALSIIQLDTKRLFIM